MLLGAMVWQLRYSVRERRLGWIRAHEGVGSRSRVANRLHQPRSVIVLTACRARCRRVSACTSLARPKVAVRHQRSVKVAISPPVSGHGSQTFLTEMMSQKYGGRRTDAQVT